MLFRIRKYVKCGRKWKYVYTKKRWKDIPPTFNDKGFITFAKTFGDGSYQIISSFGKHIDTYKINKLRYRRRANGKGQVIIPVEDEVVKNVLQGRHVRTPYCASCVSKGYRIGLEKGKKVKSKKIQKLIQENNYFKWIIEYNGIPIDTQFIEPREIVQQRSITQPQEFQNPNCEVCGKPLEWDNVDTTWYCSNELCANWQIDEILKNTQDEEETY